MSGSSISAWYESRVPPIPFMSANARARAGSREATAVSTASGTSRAGWISAFAVIRAAPSVPMRTRSMWPPRFAYDPCDLSYHAVSATVGRRRVVRERLRWRAGADEVPVAVGLVDAADGRPVLVPPRHIRTGSVAQRRVRSVLALVGMLPLISDQHSRGMRRVLQRVVLPVVLAGRHAADLTPDRDHGAAEPVQLGEILTFRGLDHKGARNGERHCRRVESVVDEPLRDVVDGDCGLLGDLPQVDDALVRHQPAPAGVEHRVVRREPPRDVVRGKDRNLGREAQ